MEMLFHDQIQVNGKDQMSFNECYIHIQTNQHLNVNCNIVKECSDADIDTFIDTII